MLESTQKEIVVQRRKKLSDVKGDNACFFVAGPPTANGLAKVNASILSGPLDDAPHLIGVEDISSDRVVLYATGQHFLKEFSHRIEKYDGTEHFGSCVRGLTGVRDDNRGRVLED